MSQDQPSSAIPPTRPRPRARSAPPPMPILEGKPKPPVRSKSEEDLRKTTAPSTTQPHPRLSYSRPSSYIALGSAESGVSTSTASVTVDSEEEYEDVNTVSSRPKPRFRPPSHSTMTAGSEIFSSLLPLAPQPLRPPSLKRHLTHLTLSTADPGKSSSWPLATAKGEELEEMSRRKMELESEIRNLTTKASQLKLNERKWERKQLNLKQWESVVAERERKLKLGEEELNSKKGDQEYHLNQEKSRLQAWDDMLEMRKKDLDDRICAVQQQELELLKSQLELWARQIEQDKVAIAQRERSVSSQSSIGSSSAGEVPGYAMSSIPRKSEKESTQQSTDRGSSPTTTEEGSFRPLSPSCLRGVDKIIDEIEFVLTDEAQSYEWTDGGFKLQTPHGALPAEAVPCRINVKASLSGQFQFPENSELVSPVYWISTPKNLRFSCPLTVNFQHCGTVEERDDLDLSFVVAKCTQPDLPYKFKFLDGGSFDPNSSYGSISVTHFSGLGIVSKQRKGRSYCARTYVTNSGRDCWSVHFVIVRDLDIVLKAVDANYSSARRDVALRVVFKQSKISLDIPIEGRLINNGWKITPRTPPYISKKDADEFRLGQWIPACELIVEWERSGQRPVRLRHQVSLIGARDPRLFFHIAIDPEWEENKVKPLPLSQQTCQENTKQELSVRYPGGLVDKPELRDLMNEVAAKIPDKWRQFGIELQLTPGELNSFSLANSGDTSLCFSSVFTLWQNRMSREPYSWLTVVESLRAPAVKEYKLAVELCLKLTRTC